MTLKGNRAIITSTTTQRDNEMSNFAEIHTTMTLEDNFDKNVPLTTTAKYLIEAVGMEYMNKEEFVSKCFIPAMQTISQRAGIEVVAYASKVLAKIIN